MTASCRGCRATWGSGRQLAEGCSWRATWAAPLPQDRHQQGWRSGWRRSICKGSGPRYAFDATWGWSQRVPVDALGDQNIGRFARSDGSIGKQGDIRIRWNPTRHVKPASELVLLVIRIGGARCHAIEGKGAPGQAPSAFYPAELRRRSKRSRFITLVQAATKSRARSFRSRRRWRPPSATAHEPRVGANARSTTVPVHLVSPVVRSRPSSTPSVVADFCQRVPMSSRFTKKSLLRVFRAVGEDAVGRVVEVGARGAGHRSAPS